MSDREKEREKRAKKTLSHRITIIGDTGYMAIKGIKGLLPSLREKKRYVVCEVLSEKPIHDRKSVTNSILSSFLSLFGEQGLAKAGLQALPDYNAETQRFMVRIAHTGVQQCKAALALVRSINSQPVIVRSIVVSGMLKKAKSNLTA